MDDATWRSLPRCEFTGIKELFCAHCRGEELDPDLEELIP